MNAPLANEDDVVVIEDADEIIDLSVSNPNVWRMLIVDDDEDMHLVTRLVLGNFEFQDHPLELISAYSAKEAYAILEKPNDIALILLDVIMETEDAGLVLARQIREELHNDLVRIVLRTGQSGQAPETEVIAEYDINDYKDKSELTVQKLRTTVISALRSYKNMKQLSDNAKELEITNQIQSAYFSAVNHELRTPLTSIRGALGLLASDTLTELPPTAKNLVQVALRNSERLSTLLSDMVDVENIAKGKLVLNLQRIDLLSLTKITLCDNEIFAQQKNITYQLDDPITPIWVMADANRIQQIYTNLLSNAVRHSDMNSAIMIRLLPQEHHVRVEVQDVGHGIPIDIQPFIFKKFSHAVEGEPNTQAGTGLGLNICKELVALMNGTIGFHSVENEGTTFWFELPISAQVDD